MELKKTIKQIEAPILIWGPPGIGKSASVYSLADDNTRVVGLVASLYEPADFAGFPTPAEGGVMKFLPPSWVKELDNGGILFLDEVNTAPPAVQAALLRVVLERRVGDYQLSKNVKIVAAANPPELAAGGWELSPPLANRFVHINFKLNPQKWVEEFPLYWNNPPTLNINENEWARKRALVAAFIMRRPDLLFVLPKEGQLAFPSPRTWDYVSRILTVSENDDAVELIAGAVGPGPAGEFLTWLKELDLPTPRQILDGCKLPERSDAAYAALSSLASFIKNNPNEQDWKTAIRVATTVATDVAVVIIRQLLPLRKKEWSLPKEINKVLPALKAAGLC